MGRKQYIGIGYMATMVSLFIILACIKIIYGQTPHTGTIAITALLLGYSGSMVAFGKTWKEERAAAKRMGRMAGKIKLYALVTNQGTAADETCLCGYCLRTPKHQMLARDSARRDVVKSSKFHDVSGNEACSCIVCGAGKGEA